MLGTPIVNIKEMRWTLADIIPRSMFIEEFAKAVTRGIVFVDFAVTVVADTIDVEDKYTDAVGVVRAEMVEVITEVVVKIVEVKGVDIVAVAIVGGNKVVVE